MRLARLLVVVCVAIALFGSTADAQTPEIRFCAAVLHGLPAVQPDGDSISSLEKHAKARGHSRGQGGVGDLQQPGGHERRTAVGLRRHRLRRRAGPADDLGAHAGHAPTPSRASPHSPRQPILLNTRNPNVKTHRGLHRTRTRSPCRRSKISLQAMMLQMAAAKQWGQANFAKLDPH